MRARGREAFDRGLAARRWRCAGVGEYLLCANDPIIIPAVRCRWQLDDFHRRRPRRPSPVVADELITNAYTNTLEAPSAQTQTADPENDAVRQLENGCGGGGGGVLSFGSVKKFKGHPVRLTRILPPAPLRHSKWFATDAPVRRFPGRGKNAVGEFF